MTDLITSPPNTPTKRCPTCEHYKPATTEYFPRQKGTKDGFHFRCKVCKSGKDKEYRVANKEKIASSGRARRVANPGVNAAQCRKYQAANKEKVAANKREYAAKNKGRWTEYWHNRYLANKPLRQLPEHKAKGAEQTRQKRLRNREEINDLRRQRYQENKERERERGRLWSAKNKEKKSEKYRRWAQANKEFRRAKDNLRRTRKLNAEGTHTADDIRRQYEAQNGRCYYCETEVGKKYEVDHVIPLARGGSNAAENIVISCPACNRSKGAKLLTEWVRPHLRRLLCVGRLYHDSNPGINRSC